MPNKLGRQNVSIRQNRIQSEWHYKRQRKFNNNTKSTKKDLTVRNTYAPHSQLQNIQNKNEYTMRN